MAYQMKVDGMAEISETLSKLEQEAPKVAARALYKGAGIMAEEINKSAGQIRTAPFQYARDGRRSRKSMIYKPLGITPEEALPATLEATKRAIANGANILRVHDVAATCALLK